MTIKEQILKLITEGKIKRNSYRYIANQIYEIVKDEYENGYQKGYKDAEIGITRSDEEVYDGPIQQCPGDCDECTLYKETEKMMSQEQAEIKELKSLIENVWREYWYLQKHYHKLTGRDYVWLR